MGDDRNCKRPGSAYLLHQRCDRQGQAATARSIARPWGRVSTTQFRVSPRTLRDSCAQVADVFSETRTSLVFDGSTSHLRQGDRKPLPAESSALRGALRARCRCGPRKRSDVAAAAAAGLAASASAAKVQGSGRGWALRSRRLFADSEPMPGPKFQRPFESRSLSAAASHGHRRRHREFQQQSGVGSL